MLLAIVYHFYMLLSEAKVFDPIQSIAVARGGLATGTWPGGPGPNGPNGPPISRSCRSNFAIKGSIICLQAMVK
jgi:hypothetical protein